MKARLLLLSAGFLLAAAPLPVLAHHAFAAEYDANQPVTLKGRLTKLEWTNPHAWLHVDVKDADGKVVSWAIEFGAPNALLRRGLRRTDFPEGIEVVIDGYRSKKAGATTVNAKSVTLPDGRNLFAGSSGTTPGTPDQ